MREELKTGGGYPLNEVVSALQKGSAIQVMLCAKRAA